MFNRKYVTVLKRISILNLCTHNALNVSNFDKNMAENEACQTFVISPSILYNVDSIGTWSTYLYYHNDIQHELYADFYTFSGG
jgi:hypothetical protein